MKDGILGYLEENYSLQPEDNCKIAELVENYIVQHLISDMVEDYFALAEEV